MAISFNFASSFGLSFNRLMARNFLFLLERKLFAILKTRVNVTTATAVNLPQGATCSPALLWLYTEEHQGYKTREGDDQERVCGLRE